MSVMAASTNGSVGVDKYVPKFRAHAMKALKQTVAADDTAADACADGQVNEIMVSHPCAILPFCKPSQIGVVIKMDRHAKLF